MTRKTAARIISFFDANVLAPMLCGFFGVKMKTFQIVIQLGDSHFTSVNPPRI
jgi:hypothetical protein